MISLGIGNNTNDRELVGIAGAASRRFHVTDFASLSQIEDAILKEAETGCKGEWQGGPCWEGDSPSPPEIYAHAQRPAAWVQSRADLVV